MSEQDNYQPDFNDIIIGLKQRGFLLISFVGIGLLFGLLFVVLLPRKFEAQSFVQLNTSEQGVMFENRFNRSSQLLPPTESLVLSQVEALKSRDLNEALVKDLKLYDNPDFWKGFYKPKKINHLQEIATQHLSNDIAIQPVGRSLVISIRYTHSHPQLSAKIVNRLIALYQEQHLQQIMAVSQKNSDWLEKRLHSLEEKLRVSAKAVEEYSAKENLVDGEQAQLTSQQLSDVSSQLMKAKSEQAGLQAKKEQITDFIKENIPLDSISSIQNVRILNILKESEIRLLTDLSQLKTKYGINHPKILALQAEINEVGAKKRHEIKIITQTISSSIKENSAKIELLEKSLYELEEKRRKENYAAIGLKELQREVDANKSLYNAFLKSYKKSKLLPDISPSNIKIISLAHTPLHPKGPHPVFIIMCFCFLSTLLGIIISLTIESVEKFIRNPEQIFQSIGLRTYAVLPEVHHKNLDVNYIKNNPTSKITEALHHFAIRLKDNPQKNVICLTSCFDNEGKTYTSIWLAEVLSQTSKKVLLIDGNLRNPTLNHYFNIQTQKSLSEIISQNLLPFNYIKSHDNLDILAANASSHADIMNLSDEKIHYFINHLKIKYDHIIIDSCNLSNPESYFLSKYSDQCFLIVRWDNLTSSVLKRTYKTLIADKIDIRGCLITFDKSSGAEL
jgi:polysaccharide biosynthesis transport protein